MPSIQITSVNYNDQVASITFYSSSDPATPVSLGSHTMPYIRTDNDVYGTYELNFAAYSKICSISLSAPTTTTAAPTTTAEPTTTTTTTTPAPSNFNVIVATKTPAHPAYGIGSALGYKIDGIEGSTLSLVRGTTYIFDQSAASNGNHPLRFSITSNGTHGGGTEYTSGVTVFGTPGQAGAYTQIVVANDAPSILYYYCTQHAGMGGQISITEGTTTTTAPTTTTTTAPTTTTTTTAPTTTTTTTAAPAGVFTLSGAGDAAVNGCYSESGAHNGKPYYSNGTYFVWYDGSDWSWFINQTVGTGAPLYAGSDENNVPSSWSEVIGSAPAPTLTSGCGSGT